MRVSAPLFSELKGAIRPTGIQVSTGAIKPLKAQAGWGHVDGKNSVLFQQL